LVDGVWVSVKDVCAAVAVNSSATSRTGTAAAADIVAPDMVIFVPAVITLPSAANICADVPPDLIIDPPVILPVTVKAVKVPTEVILGCAAVVTVPAVVAAPAVKLDAIPDILVPTSAEGVPKLGVVNIGLTFPRLAK